jgi:hypothetical protein
MKQKDLRRQVYENYQYVPEPWLLLLCWEIDTFFVRISLLKYGLAHDYQIRELSFIVFFTGYGCVLVLCL